MRYVKKVKPFHADERGKMFFILDRKDKIASALLICCTKGSIRANHYHKKDTHYTYLLKGEMEYVYRDFKKDSKKKKIIVEEGGMVFTPVFEIHAMRFLRDSAFMELSTGQHDQKHYEADTFRVKLI